MKGLLVTVGIGAAAIGLAVLTEPPEPPPPPGAVPWTVQAHRSVHWVLDCRVMSAKLTRDLYNPHDWVNRMTIDGKGSQSGHLVTDNGRCTLTKTKGEGPARLTLAKGAERPTQTTDTGARPAYAEVF